jgi:hypothetical protein
MSQGIFIDGFDETGAKSVGDLVGQTYDLLGKLVQKLLLIIQWCPLPMLLEAV